MQESTIPKIINKFNIVELNSIQQQSINAFNQKRNIILISPTGSGKTLAFLLPVLIHCAKSKEKSIIIAPSRELVLQIESVAKTMALGLKIVVCYGGHPLRTETNQLLHGFDVVIGTPGRINDHLRRANIIGDQLTYCILDEFDKTLEIGFYVEMEDIMGKLNRIQQIILTSATEAVTIPDFVPMTSPLRIVDEEEKKASRLTQWRIVSEAKDKLPALLHLIKDLNPASMIVFCNFKESVERVSHYLNEQDIANEFFHGGLDQMQREIILSKFRNGSCRVLISTDLAARGLDIPLVENVIHYHIPLTKAEFVHRNGRTARMGASGNAFIIQYENENLPEYLVEVPPIYYPKDPQKTSGMEWITVKLNRGKQDKIHKTDILGFACQAFDVDKQSVGRIEVKDKISLVALHATLLPQLKQVKDGLKIKGKSVKLEII